jgi:pimeloyl-ACP methyl ester carboxylesterase
MFLVFSAACEVPCPITEPRKRDSKRRKVDTTRSPSYSFSHPKPEAQLPAHLLPNLPVLFMYGTKDDTCPPAAVRNAHKFISRLNTVALEGVGHWVMLEAQDRVASEVLRFLSSLGSSQHSRM